MSLKTLLVSDIKVIPLPIFQSLGVLSVSHMSLKTCVRNVGVTVYSTFSISAVTPSNYAAFQFFITVKAILISSSVGRYEIIIITRLTSDEGSTAN